MKSKELIKKNIERLESGKSLFLLEADHYEVGCNEFKRCYHHAGVYQDAVLALKWVLEDGDGDLVL